MFTLAHFSDVHLTAKPLGWRPRDIFTKRASGWVSVRVLGRGRKFRDAPTVAAALMRRLRDRRPDAAAFSGDATTMGFETEFIAAAAGLAVTDPTLPPVVAVQGNHDVYVKRAARERPFDTYFAPWMAGDRADPKLTTPFARKVNGVWLIGANSCTYNPFPMDASGAFGTGELNRLRDLCDRLDGGLRVLVTHYPLRMENGELERRLHRLRDHKAALRTAIECNIGLWLHGHIHKAYALPISADIPFPVICAGSTTQSNRWSYNEYRISGRRLLIQPRLYGPDANRFTDGPPQELALPAFAE